MTNVSARKSTIEFKTKAELEKMRRAGLIAGSALNEVKKAIQPGVTTKDLDRVAESFIKKSGAIPTFVGYRGYPATICVSINDEVVHGIPGTRKIKEGDVVSIDIAATIDGFVGDTALTVCVPPVKAEDRKLVQVTDESLQRAIEMMRPGNRLGDIGATVQNWAEKNGFGVVRDFVGHGIGRRMHEEPAVPNYGAKGSGMRLEPGLVLAIEPMVTAGDWQVKVLDDGWTVVTLDGKNAAHFEHSIAVTEDGPLVLTQI